jgi:hypothetical protein
MTGPQVPSLHSEFCHLPSELPGKADLTDPDAQARIATRIRQFQADVAYAERCLADNIRNNAKYLVPEEEQTTLPARARAILNRYAVVDTLAFRYRDRTRSTFIGLLAIAFFAMLVLELFAHILPEFFPLGARPRLIFWLYPILWLSAWCLWYYAHWRQYQKKYHDYRALAEGLRVQFFWDLLGLEDRVEDFYLRKQQGELEWIRRAIAWWRERDEKAIPASEITAEKLAAQKDLVRRFWVLGQLDYFTNAGPHEKRTGKRCKRWGIILFWTSLGLAVILGGCEFWHLVQAPPETHLGLPHEESVLIFAIAMLLAGAAIAVAYGEKMAFSEHTRQYAATRILFHHYSRQLAAGPLTPAEIELFRTLGKEALQENGDWLLLHRDRPLEVIVP